MIITEATQRGVRSANLLSEAEYYLGLKARIDKTFALAEPGKPGFFGRLQEIVVRSPHQQKVGATFIPEYMGDAPAIYYGDRVLFVGDRLVLPPLAGQITGITPAISICGTDRDLIERMQRGELSHNFPMVAGHEAAILCTGVGAGCDPKMIGNYYCLESHYADTISDTVDLDDSRNKGQDGIVGGIQGSMLYDGSREVAFPGYFSLATTADISSVPPLILPSYMLEYFALPSRLESIGNDQQIMVELENRGYLQSAERTAMIIFGAGATGMPLSLLAKNSGFHVIIVEPTEWRRNLAKHALKSEAVFEDGDEVNKYLAGRIDAGEIQQTIVAVMTGAPKAYTAAYQILAEHSQEVINLPNLLIAFGLFPSNEGHFPFPTSVPDVSQRRFVLTGQSHMMHDINTLLLGVVGRSKAAWERNRVFLPNEDGTPSNPQLVEAMNQLAYVIPTNGDLGVLTELLNQGPARFEEYHKEKGRVKLGTYLVPGLKIAEQYSV